MGAVYRATDLHTGGPVAVKALHPALARDPVSRERLRREAQTAAVLTSPRVVRVVDLDAAAEPPFLVLEYVAGETLQARWRREGRLAPGAALAIVLEIARALEDAHAHGIVHRDLKPQNVMLADGQVKVLDFGIARIQELPGLTVPGAPAGDAGLRPPGVGQRGGRRAGGPLRPGGDPVRPAGGAGPLPGPHGAGRAAPARGGPPAPDGARPPGGAAGAAALPGQGPRASASRPRPSWSRPWRRRPRPGRRGPGPGGGAPAAPWRGAGDAPGGAPTPPPACPSP